MSSVPNSANNPSTPPLVAPSEQVALCVSNAGSYAHLGISLYAGTFVLLLFQIWRTWYTPPLGKMRSSGTPSAISCAVLSCHILRSNDQSGEKTSAPFANVL